MVDRYEAYVCYNDVIMEVDSAGDWVSYDDYKALREAACWVAGLDREIEKLVLSLITEEAP